MRILKDFLENFAVKVPTIDNWEFVVEWLLKQGAIWCGGLCYINEGEWHTYKKESVIFYEIKLGITFGDEGCLRDQDYPIYTINEFMKFVARPNIAHKVRRIIVRK